MVETKEFSELKPGSFLSLLTLPFQLPLQGHGQTGVIAVGLESSEKDQAESWAGDGHPSDIPGCQRAWLHTHPRLLDKSVWH